MYRKQLLEVLEKHGKEIMDATMHRIGISVDKKPTELTEIVEQLAKFKLLTSVFELMAESAIILSPEEIIETFRASCDSLELLQSKFQDLKKKEEK